MSTYILRTKHLIARLFLDILLISDLEELWVFTDWPDHTNLKRVDRFVDLMSTHMQNINFIP